MSKEEICTCKAWKILFFIVKYANLSGFCCRRRRGCLSSLIVSFAAVFWHANRRVPRKETEQFTAGGIIASCVVYISCCAVVIRELKQPRRRRQQKKHKFAYLTMENSIFARFARPFFIFWHFRDVLVLSTTWNDLFCSCAVDDVSIFPNHKFV